MLSPVTLSYSLTAAADRRARRRARAARRTVQQHVLALIVADLALASVAILT